MSALTPIKAAEIMEAVITRGDLAELSPAERAKYYVRVCESVGLNPMTQPFAYIMLNGKLVLYARKDCTDQLRALNGVSVTDISKEQAGDLYIVIAKVCNAKGRTDAATGVVYTAGLKGEALANAIMKAETKAKRRATLSVCGLGFLDETEIEDIAGRDKSMARDSRPPLPPPATIIATQITNATEIDPFYIPEDLRRTDIPKANGRDPDDLWIPDAAF